MSNTARSRRENPGRTSNSNQVLLEYPFQTDTQASKSSITITKGDFNRLTPPNFLNDTIVSFFLQYHLDTSISPDVKSQIHVFNSFFFSKIQSLRRDSENEDALKCASRWLKGVDIFAKDFLIMPICYNDHWILVIICYPARATSLETRSLPNNQLYEPAVFVLNSFPGSAPSVKRSLGRFLRYQWLVERKSVRYFTIHNAKKTGIRLIFPDVPVQKNSHNCGVYILNYFYCFLKNPRLAYIKMFRRRDLRNWFDENNINVYLERRRMQNLLRNLIKHYQTIVEVNKVDQGSQEVIVDGHSHDSSSRDDPAEISDSDSTDSVIVIN